MEATAKHDFDATVDSGVTLKRGTIVKFQFSDNKWYKAEVEGKEGLVPRNYVQLKPQDWCHGGITRGKAEELLRKQGYGGASLLQESQSSPGDFTLSVKFCKSRLCLTLNLRRRAS
ncbi:growth factor receptor-bound protein 2a [Epinephelus fuscoguttatus]|uniref:growth factor receptor-bound protein 2a n=1 Tax=Epinephelus fuscoguttatus TaxID=293821 RepID=UPI0020D1D5AE|nr:growth factor receptor-bound protein 2a [Epinephelus fuscoguttatus]